MSQAFYSAISGITAAQQKIDVIADNVANMNTMAFKESQVQFQTVLSKTLSVGGPPSQGVGGKNPRQVGLGVQVASITKNFSNGTVQATGRLSDLTIEGNGYFTTKDSAGETFLTRAGNFTLDSSGYLVNSEGDIVLGSNLEYSGQSGDTYIKIPQELTMSSAGSPSMGTKQLSELNGISQDIIQGTFNMEVSPISGAAVDIPVDITGLSTMNDIAIAMEAVLYAEPTLGLGAGDIEVAVQTSGESVGKLCITLPNGSSLDNIELISVGNCNFPEATALSPSTPFLDAAGDKHYGSGILDYVATVSPPAADSVNMTDYVISADGSIEATYSNGAKLTVESVSGSRKLVYETASGAKIGQDYITVSGSVIESSNLQIQLATVVNENGLVSAGSNKFTVGPNAGDLTYSVPVKNQFGSLKSGYLESSNVDLPTQFAEMIMTQRSIEANSRTFDTVNQVLQQIVSLGR